MIYNHYQGPGRFQPGVTRLIPLGRPGAHEEATDSWPAPIIETNAHRLYARIGQQWLAGRLCEILSESAAAEYSTRYQLMEAALQNTDRLIDELAIAVHSARQQAITRETQALAVSAGLLEPT